MEYKVADDGLPKNVIFNYTGFIRPCATFSVGAHIVPIDRDYNSATMKTESKVTAATISDTHVDSCFTRSVTTPTSRSKTVLIGKISISHCFFKCLITLNIIIISRQI